MEVLIGAGRFDVLWIENFQCPSCEAIYDRFAVQTKALGMHGYGYEKGDKIKNNIYTGEYEIEGFRYNLPVGDDEDED